MTEPGGGYPAGTGFLQIVPSFRGVQEAITREAAQWGAVSGRAYAQSFNDEVQRRTNNMPLGPSQNQSRQQGQQSGRTFADSFKARVDAALRSLPDVQVDADSTQAEIKIAELRHALEDLSNQRVGVDISAEAALAEIDRIKSKLDELGSGSSDVTVRADTATAAARLEEIQQQVRDLNGQTATVNVDDNGSVSNTQGKLGGLAQTLIGLSPLAAPVGAAIAAGLAGALETVGALGAGLGVLALGFSGVSSAVKLLGQQQQQTATGAASVARQQQAAAQSQITSANQIRSAEQSLADARRNAAHQAITSAEQVANAEQNLANVEQQVAAQRRQAEQQVQAAQYSYQQSVQSVIQAEQALMAAREAARRQLEAYANAQADSKLAAEQAAIDLQTAQANYDAVMASSTATDLQKQQAALDLAKAQQALKEANQSATQSEQDNTKAQQQGVDGSPQVVSAAQQVRQARHNQQVAAQQLTAAEQAVAQAQTQGAQQIVKAQQQIADAVRSQSWQQQASAEQIVKAQQQIAKAQQQSAYASTQAGSAGSTSLAGINYQLSKMSPATLAFARYWRSTWTPILNQIKGIASANLLPGVRKGLDALKPMLPAIERFVGAVSGVLGRMATAAGRAFNSPFWQHFLTFMTRSVGPILMDFGRVIGNVAKGFAGLMEAFGPITRTIGRALVDWSRGFAQFGASAKHSTWFRDFIAYVRKYAPAIVDFFGNLFRVVGKLLTGLAPLGGLMVTVLDDLSQFLAKLSPNQLLAIAAAIGAVFAAFGGPVVAVIAGAVAGAALIVSNWSQIAPHIQPVIDAFRAVWQFIVTKLVPVLKGILLDAWHGIQDAIHIVSRAVQGHRQQLTDVLHAFEAVIGFIVTKVLPVLGPILKAAWISTGYAIKGVILIIAGLVNTIKVLRNAALDVAHWFAGPFVNFFTGAWRDVRGAFSDAVQWVQHTWSNIWNGAKTLITAPIDAARSAIHNIWQGIKGGARTFVADMRMIWAGLERIFAAPINWLGRFVINDGLIKAWDWIAGHVPGMGGLKIDPLPQPLIKAATGAVLPGYAPGVDSIRAMLSPGEAVLRPEVTRALGADTIHGWNAAARSGRLGFANGGIAGHHQPGPGATGTITGSGPLGALSGLLSGASGLLSDLNPAHWYDWLKSKFDSVLGLMGRFSHTAVGRIIAGVPEGLAKGMLGAAWKDLKGLFSKLLPPGIGTPSPGQLTGDHAALIKAAFWAAGVPDNAANEDAVNIIASNESGWDPTAVNRTDSNWLAGHPSVGLMQTIASTFQSYVTAALRNIGPFAYGVSENPLANMVAGIRYAFSRYGSLENVPGVVAVHSGQRYVGYDQGGPLEPGVSMVYNGTGKAEVVAPRSTFDQLMGRNVGGVAAFEGNLYLDSGEFLGRVRGETNAVIDKRVGGAQHAQTQNVPGGVLGALTSPHARAASGAR